MKKLFCIFGLTLALVACSEENKTEQKATSPAESSTVVEQTKTDVEKAVETTPVESVAKQEVENETSSAVKMSEDSVAKAKAESAPEKVKKEQANKARKQHEPNDGLSPDERRVGVQQPFNENAGDVQYEKMQCRYPYMTAQERRENHCY